MVATAAPVGYGAYVLVLDPRFTSMQIAGMAVLATGLGLIWGRRWRQLHS
jgi:hypothetical protein